MIRMLHVVPQDADFQTRRGVDSLVRGIGEDFQCRSIAIAPRARQFLAVARALRTDSDYDLVHAWGTAALAAAAFATGRPILYSPPVFVRRRDVRLLRAVMSVREVHVICPTATLQRALLRCGVPLDRCHLIRPGVDFSRIRPRKDPALRSALGLAPDDRVLLAVGESTPAACHEDAAWTAGILHVLDPRNKLLVWGQGDQLPAVKAFAGEVTGRQLFRVAEEQLGRRVEFEELLSVADIAISSAAGSVATLPLAICMASAVPIISTVTSASSELLESQHTAIMLPPHSPRAMAQRILQLLDEPSLQQKIIQNARADAYQFYPLSAFLDQHRTVYGQALAGQSLLAM